LDQDITAALARLERVPKLPLHLLFKVDRYATTCAIAGAVALGLRGRTPQFRWYAALNVNAKFVLVTRAAAEDGPHALFLPHQFSLSSLMAAMRQVERYGGGLTIPARVTQGVPALGRGDSLPGWLPP
jgi:hypothetical protein